MDNKILDKENNSSAIELLTPKKDFILEFFHLHYQRKPTEFILKNLSGQFKSGRLAAILGPSGAGKSSLLNILSGFKDTGVMGTVLFNGEPQSSTDIRNMSSYIPQDFALLDHLTTIETLKLAAEFKIGYKLKNFSMVHDIIELLGLGKCSKTLVKNLSGGEQKRLSIGIELVTNPPIMFLDEPTSGLDSVSSYQVVKHLQVSARTGRIIVCVVHQPSSKLLNLFDDVYILSEGECIYGGPLDEMVTYFQNAGWICPQYYNRAEYAVEVASKEYGEDLSALISKNQEKYKLNHNDTMLDNNRGNNFVHNMLTLSTKNNSKNGSQKYHASFWEQLLILTKRSFITFSRDKAAVHIRLTSHIVIGLLLGFVYYNIGNNASKVSVNSAFVFFLVQFIFFANVLPNLLSCPLEVSVFLREHLNNWYAIGPYYLAKFVSDIPLLLLCPTIIVTIAYFITGQPPELFRLVMFWSVSVITAVLGQCMGLVLGSSFSMKNAIFLVPTICVPMLVFAEIKRDDDLPTVLLSMTYISFFRYAHEGTLQALYGYNRTLLDCKEMFCYYRYPVKFLKDMAMDGDLFSCDISALLIWAVLLQAIFLISLFVKVKMSQ